MNTRLFELMQKNSVCGLILCQPDNIAYATGFDVPLPYGAPDNMGNCPLAYAVVDADDKSTALVTSNFTGVKSAPLAEENVKFDVYDFFNPVDTDATLRDAFSSLIKKHAAGKKRIGIEFKRLPACIFELLVKEPGIELVEAQSILDEARVIKTAEEIEKLRRVAAVEDAGQNRLLRYAREFAGETEFEIYAGVHLAMNEAAGEVVRISGDLATGPRINNLWGVAGPTPRRVERADTGIFDMSVRLEGYWCDCTNTVVFGAKPNDEQKKLFDVVREAYDSAVKMLVPGNTLKSVDKAAGDAFRRHGMEPVVYTGHQVGCSVNEVPRITCYDEGIVLPGMVICLEPQNYTFDAGKTGVRLEKVLHVTENGAVELNKFEWGM